MAAGAVFERSYGFEARIDRDPRFRDALRWLEQEVVTGGLCHVVDFDARAAFVAGRLRARAPQPPPAKGDRRTKAQRRVAWQLDLQIAATCWAGGYDVATENRRDFEAISKALAALAPGAPGLAVLDPPA